MPGFVDNAKAVVSITRDGLITVILIMLIAMPATVNKSLKAAGFQKGNIAGFEWEAVAENVDANNQKLSEAAATITTLQEQLGATQKALQESEEARTKLAEQVTATMPGTAVADLAETEPVPEANQIEAKNQEILRSSRLQESVLSRQIRVNRELLATVPRTAGN